MKEDLARPTTVHLDELRVVLGKKYIKSRVASQFDFIDIATKGINANVISNFRQYFNLTRGNTAEFLNVSEPTIYRWTKGNKKLERNFSVKLFEISELFLVGAEIFGSKENFFKWKNSFKKKRINFIKKYYPKLEKSSEEIIEKSILKKLNMN